MFDKDTGKVPVLQRAKEFVIVMEGPLCNSNKQTEPEGTDIRVMYVLHYAWP